MFDVSPLRCWGPRRRATPPRPCAWRASRHCVRTSAACRTAASLLDRQGRWLAQCVVGQLHVCVCHCTSNISANDRAVSNASQAAAHAWVAAVLRGVVPPAAAHAHQLLLQQRQIAAADMQVLALCLTRLHVLMAQPAVPLVAGHQHTGLSSRSDTVPTSNPKHTNSCCDSDDCLFAGGG